MAGVSPVSTADTGLTPGTCHRSSDATPPRAAATALRRPGRPDPHSPMRVLVVEDFEVLARSIGNGLRREGMAVDVVLDGTEALDRLAVTRYDVIVLDRDLPGVHGDDICRTLAADRAESRILMLTAARSVKDRVEGLGLGADDYLPKPFDFAEMVARVQALGR